MWCTQYVNKSGKPKLTQDWKRPIFIPIPKKGSSKKCSNHQTIAFISHASKVMLKILCARLQHYMNQEFPDGLEKAEEFKLPTCQSLHEIFPCYL